VIDSATAKATHKQRGEELMRQWLKDSANEKAIHKQRGEELMQRWLRDAIAEKALHKQRGEDLMRQWLKEGANEKAIHKQRGEELMRAWLSNAATERAVHKQRGEELMRQWLQDGANEKAAHKQRGEAIAKAYAEQNARAREQEQTRLSQYSSFLKEKEAMLRADINLQRQTGLYGADSIEAHRADAQRARLAAELAYKNRMSIVSSSVQGGTSTSVGQVQATAAMNQYLATLKQIDNQLATHERAVTHAANSQHSLWLRVAAVSTIYGIWTSAIRHAYQALLSVPTTGIHYEGTKASLLAITKTTAGVSNEMSFLKSEAKRTGLSLDGLRESFRLFAASAITSGENIGTVENIFKNVNTMATTLHMSKDDINGVFLALSQIFNKGKLQAEELVKQLAQRIPGSVTMMAKAYAKAGESIQDATHRLLKDMKSGSVAAHENIKKFAEVLGTEFGGEAFKDASTGLNAEIGKLSTSWTLLTENIYKGSGRSISSLVAFGRNWVDTAVEATSNTFELSQTFAQIGLTVSAFAKALAGLAVGSIAAYIYNATKAVGITVALTNVMKANPYILAATALAGLTTAMVAYGEETRRANEAERERLHLAKQLADEREVKTPEQKAEDDRLKRVKESDTLKPYADMYKTDAEKFYKLKAEMDKAKADLAKNLATPAGFPKASGKSDDMLKATIESLTPQEKQI
jgi:tape measure domain-containing protein